MTKEELQEHYPGAAFMIERIEATAVELLEFTCSTATSPADAVQIIKDGMETSLARKVETDLTRQIRREINHRDFLRYIAGRMGSM